MGSSTSGSRKLKKLTPEKLEQLKAMLAEGHGHSAVARYFNITRCRVWQILNPDYRKKKTKDSAFI